MKTIEIQITQPVKNHLDYIKRKTNTTTYNQVIFELIISYYLEKNKINKK